MISILFYTFNLILALASVFIMAEQGNMPAAWLALGMAFWICTSWIQATLHGKE